MSDSSSTTPPPHDPDALIAAYKRDIDRTLLRENLRMTPEHRLQEFRRFQRLAGKLRRAGEELRRRQRSGGDGK
jgi:hypothetical protein